MIDNVDKLTSNEIRVVVDALSDAVRELVRQTSDLQEALIRCARYAPAAEQSRVGVLLATLTGDTQMVLDGLGKASEMLAARGLGPSMEDLK